MIPPNNPNRIQIATAAEVAARIPAKPNGKGYRTRGYCHDHADKPDSASLVFNDPPRPGEQSLHVHCFKCNPSTPAERDAIRHALQKATGLQLCLCKVCQSAHRTGAPSPNPQKKVGNRRRPRSEPQPPRAADTPSPRPSHTQHWGAHQLPRDDTGAHAHSTACPQCEQPDTLVAWTLADHPFPYCGLALRCSCAIPYDHLHKYVAKQIAAKGRQWRQEALYTLAGRHRRARVRIDPDKSIFWGGEKRNIKDRQPLCWNHPRRGQPPDCRQVLLVEGEKAAAAAVSAGIDNTHAVFSVGDANGFQVTDFTTFAGREITLWNDADSAGIKGAATAARRLAPLAGRLLLVPTDDLPPKTDAADLTPHDMQKRIHSAMEITQ